MYYFWKPQFIIQSSLHVNNIHQEVDKYGHMLWVRLWTQICVWLETDNDVDPWLVSTVCIYIFIALKKKNSYSPPQKQKQTNKKTVTGTIFKIYSEVSCLKWDSRKVSVPVLRPKLSFNICFVCHVIIPETCTGQVHLLQLFWKRTNC